MKISVITPCLNAASYIEEAVQSVLSQSYLNYEHIIVDGGSTDGTLEILEKYSHLDVIIRKSNAVQASDIGIENSKGDIVVFLNADDFFKDKDVFIDIINEFKQNPTVNMVAGIYELLHKGEIAYKQKYIQNRLDIESIGFFPPGINTFFFKKSIFSKLSTFENEVVYYSNDRLFLCKAGLMNLTCLSLSRVILVYRQHDGSLTINMKKNRIDLPKEHISLCLNLLSMTENKLDKKKLKAWLLFEYCKLTFISIKTVSFPLFFYSLKGVFENFKLYGLNKIIMLKIFPKISSHFIKTA